MSLRDTAKASITLAKFQQNHVDSRGENTKKNMLHKYTPKIDYNSPAGEGEAQCHLQCNAECDL